MISIARKNMLAGKGRFAFSVAGVAVAVLLLSFILALYRGWSERLTAYLDDTPADLWVVQKGNESFFSPSIVRDANLDLVRNTPGVERTSAIVGRTLRIRHEGEGYDVYIMGFQTERGAGLDGGSKLGGVGGPLHMKKGSGEPRAREIGRPDARLPEIVIDDVLARIAGIAIGDEVTAGDQRFTVVGISSGGNLGVTLLCFVDFDEAARLVGGYPIVSYYLLNTERGKNAEVKASIESRNPGLTVFESREFAESSRQVLRRSLLPVLGLVVALVFAVGAIVVGLTIFTATIEKEREFGVMKAIGTPNVRLMAVVFEQSLVCCLLGFVIGELAVQGATRLAEVIVPQFVTLIRWQDVALVFVAAAVMSAVAAWFPIQRVTRVDPLLVFKA